MIFLLLASSGWDFRKKFVHIISYLGEWEPVVLPLAPPLSGLEVTEKVLTGTEPHLFPIVSGLHLQCCECGVVTLRCQVVSAISCPPRVDLFSLKLKSLPLKYLSQFQLVESQSVFYLDKGFSLIDLIVS